MLPLSRHESAVQTTAFRATYLVTLDGNGDNGIMLGQVPVCDMRSVYILAIVTSIVLFDILYYFILPLLPLCCSVEDITSDMLCGHRPVGVLRLEEYLKQIEENQYLLTLYTRMCFN